MVLVQLLVLGGWATRAAGSARNTDGLAARMLTVFHIGPRNVSRNTIPANMNSGDARGEMYWDLGWKVEALECANRSAAPHLYASDCLRSGDNYLESQNTSNLVITQVELEIDGEFDGFASCVPDQFGRNYRCSPNSSAVGTWNLTEITPITVYGNCSSPTDGCRRHNLTRLDFWRFNTWQKFGGQWYSTPTRGRCAAEQPVGHAGCTWKVRRLIKQVAKECSDRGVFSTVVRRNQNCFGRCPLPQNTSSACFVNCFYETMLGPRAGDGIGPKYIGGGMHLNELERAWAAPFQTSDALEGGCPDLLDPSE